MLKNTKNTINAIAGGSMLVTGTCIGAGMLGLPVEIAATGFSNAAVLFVITWIIMCITALAFLEVCLTTKEETNLISLAHTTLGPWGSKIAWLTYLLFLYSVLASYAAGGTTMLAETINFNIQDNTMRLIALTTAFVLPFAIMVCIGARCVDYINRWLMCGLVISFALMCYFSISNNAPTSSLALHGETKYLGFALPLMITSFGYHLLIPTLTSYLKGNVFHLRWAILIGATIPFIIYLIWNFMVLSLIPTHGAGGILEILHSDLNPSEQLIAALAKHNPHLSLYVAFFSFFALASSLVGVALGLLDFLADGCKLRKQSFGNKILLAILTFMPPIIYTVVYPKGFLLALHYASIFTAILLVIYPAMMAWSRRYITKLDSPYQVFGGKFTLSISILFGIAVVCCELFTEIGILPTP